MKKLILIFAIALITAFSASAQRWESTFKVNNAVNLFGTSVSSGTLVCNANTGQVYILTANATAGNNLNTATKTLVGIAADSSWRSSQSDTISAYLDSYITFLDSIVSTNGATFDLGVRCKSLEVTGADHFNNIGSSAVIPLNFAIGGETAGRVNPTLRHTYFGALAGANNLGGQDNVGIGEDALYGRVGIDYNYAVGVGSGAGQYSLGNYNVYIGYRAGQSVAAATSLNKANVGIGYTSLSDITTVAAEHNTAIGHGSGGATTTGAYNTFVGSNAGVLQTTQSNNVYLGYTAGQNNTSLSNRLFISGVSHGCCGVERDTIGSIIYGYMNATTANQRLYFNANVYGAYDLDIEDTITCGVLSPDTVISLYGASFATDVTVGNTLTADTIRTDTIIAGGLNVTGAISSASIAASGLITADSISTSGGVNVTGNLAVGNASALATAVENLVGGNGWSEATPADTLFSAVINCDTIVQGGMIILSYCGDLADDGTINLPDATAGVIEISVNDGTEDELIYGRVYNDGSVTIVTSNGSTANTESDGNLCLYDGGGTTSIIKNMLGSELKICFTYKYPE